MTQQHKVGTTATTINCGDNSGQVKYHNTVVVEWTKDTITLNSDGWLTATTKTRMNQTSQQFDLFFSVWQKNHSWFVSFKNVTVEFFDGMTLKR